MTDRRDMSGTSNYLHWGNETAFATNTITTSLEHGVITFGKRVVLEGAGPIDDVASIVFSLQEASVDGITTRDYLTVLAAASRVRAAAHHISVKSATACLWPAASTICFTRTQRSQAC